MIESEHKNPEPVEGDLTAETTQLRRQLNFLLLGLTIISLTFTAYLGMESKHMGSDLEAGRLRKAQAQEVLKGIDTFVSRLYEFSQTHGDLAAVLAKYPIRVVPNANAASVPPAPFPPAPAPSPATPQKK